MFAPLLLALAIAAQTDQTVQVQKGTRLDLTSPAGDVLVKVWDRDAVHVEAEHSTRETVDIQPGPQTLSIRSRSARGPSRSVDYTITAPAWMPISIKATYADVTLDGVGSDVSVETNGGDIRVTGGNGFVSLKSVQGQVTLARSKGRVEVRSVNEGIFLSDISGDLMAETTNGSITLDRIDSVNVDLYTVNGNISYDGPIRDKGMYRLTTHNGQVAMPVPENANMQLTVRTYSGSFRSTFPLKLDEEQSRRKRFTLTLGNGSARVDLESFGGTIALRRPGEPRPESARERRQRERDEQRQQNDRGRGQ
jgi:DUF4097 and DUF4098 domain-containing protein YvlB